MVMWAFVAGNLSALIGVLIGWAISDKTTGDESKKGVVFYTPNYKEVPK